MKRVFRWVAAARLPGEGMHPLSNPTHHRITQAALAALPAEDREFLAPEADLLVWSYCGLPDMNWHWYGTFAQDAHISFDRRLPDVRREWEIPRYCFWNSLTRTGRWFPHWPPDALDATVLHFGRAREALAAGAYHDAIRILGVCLHYAQDAGSPAHAAHVDGPLHLPMERIDISELQAAIVIPGYRPVLLGTRWAEAAAAVRQRGEALVKVALAASEPIRHLCEAGEQVHAQPLMVPCAQECARYTADLLHTFCVLADHARPETPVAPVGESLLRNGSLAQPDDTPEVPATWYIHWQDLADTQGQAARVAVDDGFAVSITSPPGAGIHWRTSWPEAVRVTEGVRLRLRFRYRMEGPHGAERATIRFYSGNTTPVGAVSTGYLAASRSWQTQELIAEAPAGSVWARVSLEAAAGAGTILFRDVVLERVA